jgi:DNA-binding NtrC family response regulator
MQQEQAMNLTTPVAEKMEAGTTLKIPEAARILIVSDDGSDAEGLKDMFLQEGFVSEYARSIDEGCDAVKSGRFQVVVSRPVLKDGSWKQFAKIANRYDLGIEVVLWAQNVDSRERGQALDDGAFDILDASREQQPRAAETTKRALWSAILKGAGPHPVSNPSHQAA